MKTAGLGLLLILFLTGTTWSQEEAQTPPVPASEAAPADKPTTDEAAAKEPAAPEPSAETPAAEAEPAEDIQPNEDETAILAAVDSYAEAFNQGDAKALAGHWTEDGELVTPSGDVLKGHTALETAFTAYFAESSGAKLELFDTHIKMVSPRVASETGMAQVTVGDEPAEITTYEAVHVKTADGWRMDSVREVAAPAPAPTHYQQLQSLEWMIGTWVDNSAENASIETTGRWTTNSNFIVRTFRVFVEDRVDFEGTQIIGWDPSAQAIRSWTFDSDGGFGVGRWSQNGDRWTVQALNVLPDGRRASSTNIYDVVDESTLQFHSIGRQVDGEIMPSIDTVTLVRAQ